MSKPTESCTIHRSLLISLVIVPAIPLLLAAMAGFHFFSETTRDFAVKSIRQAAVDRRIMVDTFLEERRADLTAFLAALPQESLSDKALGQTVAMMLKIGGEAFQDMGLINSEGKQVAYAGPYDLLDRDYRQAHWYLETLNSGYYVSDVFLGYRNVPHFVVAVTRRIDNQPWVLRATIDSSVFERIVDAVNVGDSGEAYILNSKGLFQTGRRSGGALLEQARETYPAQTDSLASFTGTDGGSGYLYASALLNDGKWRLLVRLKESEAFRTSVLAGYAVAILLLCGLLVILVLAFTVSRKLSETIHEKTEAVGKLESQLLQAARLAELGEMAAGFAHEINNPLQIMKTDLALLDLLLNDISDQASDKEACAEVREIAEQFQVQISRCAAITQEILRFGRRDAPKVQPIDLAEYLPKVGAMVENKASVHGIRLDCEVQQPIPIVLVDPGQLQQVMINLMNNAIHAVVEHHGSEGGSITVTAAADGGNAVIRVADNGSGMSQDTLAKIFFPFFTTKGPGQGTGLGLSVCHSIIDSLGGELSAESSKGKGTVFTVVLPGGGTDIPVTP